jgi:hypothetical protein
MYKMFWCFCNLKCRKLLITKKDISVRNLRIAPRNANVHGFLSIDRMELANRHLLHDCCSRHCRENMERNRERTFVISNTLTYS